MAVYHCTGGSRNAVFVFPGRFIILTSAVRAEGINIKEGGVRMRTKGEVSQEGGGVTVPEGERPYKGGIRVLRGCLLGKTGKNEREDI